MSTSQHTIEYVISAVDKASATIDGIGKSLKDNAQEFRNVGLAAGVMGGAILAALGSTINPAREAIMMQNQLNAVLKSTKGVAGLTADELNKMASSLQSVTNYGDESITRAQSLMLTFTKVGSDIFPRAIDSVLDMSSAMGTDLKASVIQLGKALNDPIRGVSALSDVGVQFTNQQREMIDSFVASGDVISAQKVILGELETQFGGTAQAMADPLIQIKNSMSDLAQEIGEVMIPMINDFVQKAMPMIQTFIAWIEEHQELAKTITIVIAAIAAMMVTFGALALSVSAITTVFAGFAILFSPAGLVMIGLAALATLVLMVIQNWDTLSQTFKDFGTILMDNVSPAIDFVFNSLQRVADAARSAWSVIQMITGQSLAGWVSDKIMGRQSGGMASGLVRVGERGAENVILPQGSHVMSAGATSRMGGGGGVNINVSAPIIGTVYVTNEADETRLASKVQDAFSRMIQLQQLRAA